MACLVTPRPLSEPALLHEEIRVETISDYQEFLDLEPVWNEVAQAAGLDHPFLEHTWVRTWWECFGAGSRLQILVLRAGDQTLAIAPLIQTPIRMWGIKVRRLGFFYNAHVPRADFLIAQRREEVYRALWSHLSQSSTWDLLQLCQIPEGSATLEAIAGLAGQDQCHTVTWVSGASPYLAITSWERYVDSLPAKHRANLRNRLKRLNGIGKVAVETIDSGEMVADAVEAGVQLEAAAWKGEAGTAIASDQDVSRFYSTLAQRAAERGWMRLHFLQSGPQRVAFDYSLSYKSRIHLLKSGYDPAFAPYSPSNLLLFLILQDMFGRGDVTGYDFLGETADWKLQWTKDARPNYWLFVFPDSLKGRLLHLIKSQFVPLLKHNSLRPLRNLVLRLVGRAQPERR